MPRRLVSRLSPEPNHPESHWNLVVAMAFSQDGSCVLSDLLLLRITEYNDDRLRPSKTLIEFGSPRPNAGEGSGVRGPTYP